MGNIRYRVPANPATNTVIPTSGDPDTTVNWTQTKHSLIDTANYNKQNADENYKKLVVIYQHKHNTGNNENKNRNNNKKHHRQRYDQKNSM